MEAPLIDFVFVDPPKRIQRRNTRYPWAQIVQALVDNPGEWALVLRQVPRSTAQALRRGRVTAVRPPRYFQIITRNGVEGRADLYMKYVGPRNGEKRG